MTVALSDHSRKTPAIPPDKRLLIDEEELAELLGVSKPTARAWVADGHLHPVELPGSIRRNLYRLTDVEAWVASRGVRP